jgi:Tfp pilus assembly protein PilZ
MDRTAGIERRQHPRVVVNWPVIMKSTQGFMAGETKDVSNGGAFISCREPLKPKEVFELAISVSLLHPRVKAIAEVIWSNPSRHNDEPESRGMGVRFIKIADKDLELISALVSNHLKPADSHWQEEKITD